MTAPVAPPAPDLRQAIEEAEEELAKKGKGCRHLVPPGCVGNMCEPCDADYAGLRWAFRTLLAASRAAMEERKRMREALERAQHAARHWSAPTACRKVEAICADALAPAAKEENRNG